MVMLNINNFVPEAYYDKSRDFQLFSKLLEVVINSVKHNSDSITKLLSPSNCKDSMLDRLNSLYNYNPKIKHTNDDLRIILEHYKKLINNKGNHRGIEQAILLALRLQNKSADFTFTIKNKIDLAGGVIDNTSENINIDEKNSFIIQVGIPGEFSTRYLKEFLDLIKPVGYLIEIHKIVRESAESNIGTSISYNKSIVEVGELEDIPNSSIEDPLTEINRQEIITSQQEGE